MLQAKELRVGNLLQCRFERNGEWRTIEVTGLKVSSNNRSFLSWKATGWYPEILLLSDEMLLINEGYRGIPLTHSMLIKMGFKTMDYEYDFIDWARQDTELYFSMTQTGIPIEAQPFIFSYDHQGTGDVKKQISYLHQLQNLYLDLTGKELSITD